MTSSWNSSPAGSPSRTPASRKEGGGRPVNGQEERDGRSALKQIRQLSIDDKSLNRKRRKTREHDMSDSGRNSIEEPANEQNMTL